MSLITTNDGRIVLKKAQSMMAVPYVYDSTIGDYVLGDDVYDISAIIGDSTTIEQSDGESEAKYNEFKASPLIETVSGSKYNLTAQCLDLQSDVLKPLFGAMTAQGGSIAFHDDFVLRYALIRIRFEDETLPDVVMPKVQLNSKLFVQQLKTRASQGNIAGTALAVNMAVADSLSSSTAKQFDIPSTGGTTYVPYTPIAFVPRGDVFFVYQSRSGSTSNYAYVDFDGGSVRSGITVNESSGAITL